MRLSFGVYPLLVGLIYLPAAFAAGMGAIEEDITVLKEDTAELNSRLDEMLTISGYTDVEYIVSSKAATKPGFRIHHLSLFFEKQITDKWRFFSEIEYEDGPFFEDKEETVNSNSTHTFNKAQGKIFVEAVNMDFLWRPDVSFRVGRFFAPAGIWNVDHYPPFVPTQQRPLHIHEIFPQIFDGAMVYGTRPLGGSFLKYDLYWGNGEGNTGKKDSNSHKATGLNVRVVLPVLKHTELGMTYYQDTLNDGEEKTATGAHLKIKAGSFTLQSEYAKGDYKPVSGADYERAGNYTQLMYGVSDWAFGVRSSFYDSSNAGNNELTANGLFVNYQVSHTIVLKVEHHQFNYDDATKDDYKTTTFSVVAYLGN